MSKATRGRDATIYVGGINASAYLNEYEIQSERDDLDVTPFEADDKEYLSGPAENTTTLTGFWNGDADSLDDVLDDTFGSDDANQILVCPGGVLSGKHAYILGDATQLKYKIKTKADDITEAEAEFRSKRSRAVILKTPATVSASAAGTPDIVPLATNFGVIAAMHLLDITGDPTAVQILLEHSVDGNTWTTLDTFGNTFTVADIGSAVRIEMDKTALVNVQVRSSLAFTGGTSPTAKYVAAYHRRIRA